MDKLLIAEAIERAALVIRIPEWWTQGRLAEDADGESVDYDSPKAACFCAIGAAKAAAEEIEEDLALGLWAHLDQLLGEDIAEYNDAARRTPRQVSDAMLAAAQRIREQA